MDNARSVDVCYVNERAMRATGSPIPMLERKVGYLQTLNDDDNMVMMVMAQ
jgi:hypothetical protein